MFGSKIVVTGMGMVSPLGSNINHALDYLERGQSGVKPIEGNPYCYYGALVNHYEATQYVPKKLLRRMERVNHFALNAAGDALAMAHIHDSDLLEETGVVLGTGYAGIESVVKHQKSLHDDGIKMLRPIHFPTTVYNATAGFISIQFKTKGINTTLTGLDMPAEYSLLYACMILQRQPDAKVVVIGADSCTEHLQQGIYRLGFLSRQSTEPVPCAFEKTNDGIIMGEGAGAIVVETEHSAKSRGVPVIAELKGIFQHSSAIAPFDYDTEPNAALNAIHQLCTSLNADPNSYDLLTLSANGSPALNRLEQAMLESLNISDVPCRALSDYLGTFPGAGILRMILSISALKSKRNIQSLHNHSLAPNLEKLLSKKLNGGRKYLHVANGLGGNAMAIGMEVME